MIMAFGFIVLTGGVMGFVKAQSLMSMIMGGAFGILLMTCGLFVYKGSIPFFFTAAFTTIFLHLFFLYRFLKSFAIMPAGLMVLLTTAVGAPLVYFLTRHVKETSSIDA